MARWCGIHQTRQTAIILPPVAAAGYRFGPYQFNCTAYQLSRGSQPIDLTPKLLDLLVYLLERPATLVTKEELLDALWPGANVTENALAQAVSDLRQMLGDEPSSPQFIRTIARRGYRFVAPVTPMTDIATPTVSGSSTTVSAQTNPPESASDTPDVTHPFSSAADAGQSAKGPAIAVLDFAQATAETADAWLSVGVAETVTNDLRRVGQFRVIDRRRVLEATRGTDGSLDQISAALSASLLVVGTIQTNQNRVRITARIVDVANGEALADAKVDGALDDIFSLQDDVVRQLARELALPRSGATHARDTASLGAFQAFTEGWMRLESLEIAQMERSRRDFERAIAADARYARAYAGLSSAELACYESTRSDTVPDRQLLDRAIAHAQQATELDDTLAEAHGNLALVLASAGRFDEAALAGRRAVALESSNWRHWFRLGHATWGSRRLRAATQTLALYPEFAFSHFQAAMVHVARRDFLEAETVLRQGAAVQDRQIARGGRYPALGLHWLLGLVRLAGGDIDEALSEFDREAAFAQPVRLYGREFQMHAATARAAALMVCGRTDEAIDNYRRALISYPDEPSINLALASALRAAGRDEEAATCRDSVDVVLPTIERTRPLFAAMVKAERLLTESFRLKPEATDRREEVPARGAELSERTAEGRDGKASATVAAAAVLLDALKKAPPGFACWTLPIEPAFRQVIGASEFAPVLEILAARAG